ncbi:MAG: hypothetical protein ABJA80_13605 [bacterium]
MLDEQPGSHRHNIDRLEMQPRDDARADDVESCERAFRAGGVVAVLRCLNARTRFRYTAVYRADPPMLRTIEIFDRENPTLSLSSEVTPLRETYCGLTRDTNASFQTEDAMSDIRLANHPARESVLSYCGTPIRLASGRVWGSVCHFDVRPRLISAGGLAFLESVAPHFARWLDLPA